MNSILTNQSNMFTAMKSKGALTGSASRSIIDCCCACNGCSTKHPVIQKGKEALTCKAKADVAAFSPLLPRTGGAQNLDTQSNNTNSKYGKVLIDLNHVEATAKKAS